MNDDPVLARRALFARAAVAGKRAGYLLLLVAMIAFAAGFKAGFGGAVTAVVVACMIGSTLTLAPGIVINYAVRAAEREDRQRGRPE
ncbi:MAG: hypothetical protein ABIW46_05075 [Acidimicrobiales bacterium]